LLISLDSVQDLSKIRIIFPFLSPILFLSSMFSVDRIMPKKKGTGEQIKKLLYFCHFKKQ